MKKILTIFLAASLLLVACGKDKEEINEIIQNAIDL